MEDDVRGSSVVRRLLGVEKALVEGVAFEDGDLVVHLRLHKRQQLRCGYCGKRCGKYDNGRGRRRWRSLDSGTTKVWFEADTPRVRCRKHGVVAARVTWARAGKTGYTSAFEDQVAWLAAATSQHVVSQLMRIAWRSVGKILTRVVGERRAGADLLDGLTRIGIDETSYRKGHRYLTVVVCHDTGRLVWAAPGNSKEVINKFLEELGADRRKRLTHVTCDGAEWIHDTIRDGCENAAVCLDAFHICKWASDAVDEIRRELWNDARRNGDKQLAGEIKGTRWALLKSPGKLTKTQRAKLSQLQRDNGRLYRAYLLKEQLRLLLKLPLDEAMPLLEGWLAWASRSRLAPFVKVARTIRRQKDAVVEMLHSGLTNGRVESINAKIRVIQQRAFGFHDPEALISLAMLTLSGLCPPLPGRTPQPTHA